MTLTLQLPDEFAAYLPSKDSDMAEVLSAGLRAWQGRKRSEIQTWDDVTTMLANLPSPQDVLELHPSPALASRTGALLEKSRDQGLTESEQCEWVEILHVEHLVRIAKAKALIRLKAA